MYIYIYIYDMFSAIYYFMAHVVLRTWADVMDGP